ncbi:hypothetical protein M405DRAFT_808071, partial [Rhizopogon salebrosus TDB-379]
MDEFIGTLWRGWKDIWEYDLVTVQVSLHIQTLQMPKAGTFLVVLIWLARSTTRLTS